MKRIIVVLGMHRGGTSAIARSLVALGVPLGDTLMPPLPDNPTGFWEDRQIVDLNDRALAALGLQWHSLAPIPDRAFVCDRLDDLKTEARELLAARLLTRQLWGFKDPRTSRLLRFWEPIFRDVELSAAYILAVRNPLSVAASLEHRNGFPAEKCYLLWALHMVPLLRLARSPRTVIVDYDSLLDAPERELARMAESLSLPPPTPQAITAYGSEFLDLALRHSQFDLADITIESRAVDVVACAYDLLVRGARGLKIEPGHTEPIIARFEALSPLLSYAHALDGALAAQAGRIAALEQEAPALRHDMAQKKTELARLAHERHAISEQAASSLAELRSEQGEMRRSMARLAGDLASLKSESASHLETLKAKHLQRSAFEDRIARRLEGFGSQLGKLRQTVAGNSDHLSSLAHRVGGLIVGQAALRAQADCHDAEILAIAKSQQGWIAFLGSLAVSRAASAARRLRRVNTLVGKFLVVLRQRGLEAGLRRTAAFVGARLNRPRPMTPRRPNEAPASMRHLASPTSLTAIRARGPVISVLTPVFNTPAEVLEDTIQSVLKQSYPNWELCICDDCSSNASTLEVLEKYRGTDWRIKIVRAQMPLHIARATNLAAELATGEFVGFLDHDDLLEVDALQCVAQAVNEGPDVDFIYTDEDKMEMDGRLTEPNLKPDWSPELLLSVMYTLHFTVVRKSLFLKLGGLRHEYTGSQDYDLALRATAQARRIIHIPRILYHWRKTPGSAAAVFDAKPQALRNARLALQDFVRANDPEGQVQNGLLPGTYRVKWSVGPAEPVTLAILTGARYRDVEGRGKLLLVENFVDSILSKSTYPHHRLLIVDDDGNLPAHVRQKTERAAGRVVSFPLLNRKFNFSEKTNFALSHVQTDHVILLNDDLEVISRDWIEALLAFSRRPDIGAVGARLLFADRRIQHAGVVLGVNGPAGHVFHRMPAERVGYCGYTHLVRNYSAVTAAVIATRMSLIREVGGFDESLAVDFSDIDFCLRVRSAGYRIVYTPYAELYHFESSSLRRRSQSISEQSTFLRRWRPLVERDPYYHPQLSRARSDFKVA